ncbi:MAG: hypothetical protein Ct9H300mP1_24100 [Planctomycetaceae bacterium]|nr:MAG: hypothetical protein Ct9H300mP1_24100 [Planctomycetaceae bacterium]
MAGKIVESDLLNALQNGPLAAAGPDVFEQEPATADNPLFALDNIVVSPHLAGADTTSIQDMANEAADCIASLYEGSWPGPGSGQSRRPGILVLVETHPRSAIPFVFPPIPPKLLSHSS